MSVLRALLFSLFLFYTVSADTTAVISVGTVSSAGKIPELGVIIVTGKKSVKTAKVDQVVADDFQVRGDQTVLDALEMTPGVLFCVGQKNETDIKIRGMNSRRVLVLVDGRPLNMPYYGTVDLNTIPLDNVERIMVSKGAPTLLYGVNGPAGVVNIITKNPLAQDGWAGKVQGNYGPNATWGTQADVAGLWNRWSGRATLYKGNTDGYSLSHAFTPTKIENGDVRDNSDFDRLNLTGKVGYQLSPENEVAMSGGYYHDDKGIPSDVYWPQYRRFTDWKRWYVDGTGKLGLGGKASLNAKLFYDRFVNEMVEYEDPGFDTISWDSFHRHWDAGGILLFELPLGAHNFALSINGKQEVASTEGYLGVALEEYDMYTVSSALEYTYTVPAIPLSFKGGAGYSRSGAGGDDRLAAGYAGQAFDGMAGSSFDFNDKGRIYAGFGVYTRYPTLSQLSSEENGNPDLKTERSIKTEIGAEYNPFSMIEADIALFNEQYRDMIDKGGNIFRNLEGAWSRGLECGVSFHPEKAGTKISVNYTLDKTRNEENKMPLAYVPVHLFQFEATQKMFNELTVYMGGRWAINRAYGSGVLMDDYFITKAKVRYVWRILSCSAMVDNIFDVDYATESANFPMAGRTFRFELGMAIKNNMNDNKQ